MKRRLALVACVLLAGLGGANAASVALLTGPQDVSQMNARINGVIQSINTILTPLTGGATSASAINQISLTPALTGYPAVIGVQPTGDTDTSIGLAPAGDGDIILWSGNTMSVGVLQFANASSFIVANGLGACPGVAPGTPPFGVSDQITGYVPFKDWLGVARAFPAC